MAIADMLTEYQSEKKRLVALENELKMLEENLATAEANIIKAQGAISKAPANMASAAASLDQAAAVREALVQAKLDLDNNKTWRDAVKTAIDTKRGQVNRKISEIDTSYKGIWKTKRDEIVGEILAHEDLFKKLHAASIMGGMSGISLPQRVSMLAHEILPATLPDAELVAVTGALEAEIGF